MGIEGRLKIGMRTASGYVKHVCIESSRPVHASRVLQGRSVDEALRLLPVLFGICGTAQACAGVRACEQAIGVKPTYQLEQVRDCLVRMEIVREHLWRILLDWPLFIGETPQKNGMTDLLALQREYRQTITRERDPFLHPGDALLNEFSVPHDLVDEIAANLEQTVFGMPPDRWLAISTQDILEGWAASKVTVAARLLDHVLQADWCDIGKCDVQPLPIMRSGQLHQALQNDDFVLRPEWLDHCRESSCLTRVDSSLLQRLRVLHGNGLLVRLAARLTEIAQVSQNLLPDLASDDVETFAYEQNPGIGQVAAARGQLIHRVQIETEQIIRYQILAPTEWNFHPQGVVAKGLASVSGDAEIMVQQARLLINAIDPCVDYELSIVQNA